MVEQKWKLREARVNLAKLQPDDIRHGVRVIAFTSGGGRILDGVIDGSPWREGVSRSEPPNKVRISGRYRGRRDDHDINIAVLFRQDVNAFRIP